MFVEKLESTVFYLLILFLPTQLGKHFWPDFSIISGIRIDYLSPTVYVTDVLVGLVFITWLVNTVQRSKFNSSTKLRARVQSYSSKVKVYFILICFLLLNIFLSHNIWNGFYHLLKLLEFSFLAYYVSSTITRISQIKKIFFLLGVGVFGQSLLAIAQFLIQASIGGIFYFFGERTFTAMTPGIANADINGKLLLRSYGTFSHPNVLAGFLLVSMMCLLFSLPWVKKGFEKYFLIVALLLGSSALLLTMSRLAVILWVALLAFVLLNQIQQKVYKLVAGVILLGSIMFLLLATPFGARLIQTNLGEESVVQREVLIQSSTTLFTSQPFIGIGLGNFIPRLATIQKPLTLALYLQPVHNIFLFVLVETGIVGLGFFIVFLLKTYKKLFTDIKTTTYLLSSRIFLIVLSVMLIIGLFDHYWLTLQQGQLLFSLVIGFSWAKLHG